MTDLTPEQTAALNERHRVRMERKKAIIDAKIAAADKKIGIIIVNTGNGKGKSSSAFGMVGRALGHGMKVGVVQFIKGAMSTGDELFRMGLMYSTGQGGAPIDYVSAHMLFNLAAMRGSVEAKVYRKELSQEMASEDIAEAQRQARQWLAHG